MAGIYLHIPFCKQACSYCDFHFSTSLKKKEEILTCMQKELILRKAELQNTPIETIYFGGGTPSLLNTHEIRILIQTIQKHYTVIEHPEITLEANPDDLIETKIIELAESPVNRLSIGVQSFFEDDLKLMNRAHNAHEAKKCLVLATGHFDNITVDLIYGVPNMTNERWRENLQTLFDLGIHHISSYALTVEPKTALESFIRKGTYTDVDEQVARAHFEILVSETKKQGFVHYEISNFGKPNFFSKHNTSYWQGKKYLGIGPSAHSFNGTHRSWNVSNNTKYIKCLKEDILPNENEELSLHDRFNEYIMTGLRTIWGVSLHKVEQDFGVVIKEHLLAAAEKFIQEGLLQVVIDDTHLDEPPKAILKTTQKGKFLADGLASELFII